MSNLLSPHTSIQSIWRGKNPGANELSALLNTLTMPAMIIEARHNAVLSVNSEFLKLTAYSLAEIARINLDDLLPDISKYEIVTPGDHETTLTRHLREPVDVLIHGTSLDTAGNWHLLTFVPKDQYKRQRADQSWQEKFTLAIQNLFGILSQADLQASLAKALESAQNLLSSKIICIYQYDTKHAQFVKAATTENKDVPIFPERIDSTVIPLDPSIDVWMPGKRVSNEIHRIGRVAGLPYIASSFLVVEGATVGLLGVADTQGAPVENLERLLQVLSISIGTAFYHHILVQSLDSALAENRRDLLIRDTALENTQEGIIIVSKDLLIENLNPAAEMIFGYANREVVGIPVENILVGTEPFIPALKAAMDGIPTHNLGNVTLHRRSGQPFPGHLQTIPVMADDGLMSIILIVRDISENEMNRVRTQQLEQRALLGEVTAIFAHEVRNPINNISTGLQLLQMKFEEADPNQEIISHLQQDCTRLTHLMESVLSFSRPMEYKMIPINLDVLVKRFLDRWRPRFAKANVQAYYQIEPDTLWVIGDPMALERVLTNLVSNAVSAMKNGGLLAVKLQNRGLPGTNSEVEITISDSGPGIPDEIKDHIFEPFMTTNPQGTGLGLAITKRIVNAHRGSISVSSFPGGTRISSSPARMQTNRRNYRMSATILIVDDEEHARQHLSSFLVGKGYEVQAVATLAAAREALQKGVADIVLLDVTLEDGYGPNLLAETLHMAFRPPIILITAYGDIDMAVEAMKNGAHDFLQKPIELTQLEQSIQRANEIVSMRRELAHLRSAQHQSIDFIVGETQAMKLVMSQAQRASNAAVSVIVTGESGTGKEVLAQYIHKNGPRSGKPFIAINCAAIQPTMLESELFGYEAGAFTGAEKKKVGLMEVADGGILFLDELSSMPLDIQGKLLRAIEEQAFRRVGGTNLVRVDVQILAASNRNLMQMIGDGKFREDLYYRLKVVDLNLPPLRSRKQDIPDLVGYFIRKTNSKLGLNIDGITPKALQVMVEYPWPGNIRELMNVIERTMLFCDDPVIDVQHLPYEMTTEH